MAARLNSGSPNYGVGLELSAIAAAVIGGASLSGGRGSVLNTAIGAMTIVIVQNGLNLNAVPTSVQNVVIGAIIVLAVGIDMWRHELARTLGYFFPTRSGEKMMTVVPRRLPSALAISASPCRTWSARSSSTPRRSAST